VGPFRQSVYKVGHYSTTAGFSVPFIILEGLITMGFKSCLQCIDLNSC